MPEVRFNTLHEKDVESAKHKFENFDWPPIEYEMPVMGNQYRLLDEIREDWRDRLYALSCEGHIHEAKYKEQIRTFCQFLINHQRDRDDRNIKGFWCIPEDIVMPNDASVDFLQLPTRIAVSILVLVLIEQPALALSIKGYESALKKGLNFVARFRLTGHGYESNHTLVESIEILAIGGVFEFVHRNTEYCPAFNRMIRNTEHTLDQLVSFENGNQGWGVLRDGEIDEAKRTLTANVKPHDIMRNYEQKKSLFHRDIEYFHLYSAFTVALGDFLKRLCAELPNENSEAFLEQAKLALTYSKPSLYEGSSAVSDTVIEDQEFCISSILTMGFLLQCNDNLSTLGRCLSADIINAYWERYDSKKEFIIGDFEVENTHFNVLFKGKRVDGYDSLVGNIYLSCQYRTTLSGFERHNVIEALARAKQSGR